MDNRDCNTCIWHTENGCASWDCDYISRDEAVKAVKAILGKSDTDAPIYDEEWRKTHYQTSYNKGFFDGVKMYEKSHPEQKWIPCSDCERKCDKWENSKT